MKEPQHKRAAIFVDGQNLYHAARRAFGIKNPDYDIAKLSRELCRAGGWHLVSASFYTGIPDKSRDPNLYDFWNAKLLFMGRRGIRVFSRPLRYSKKTVVLRDGSAKKIHVPREKGVDIRIALDVIHGARENLYDVAVILSQDQDFEDVAGEIRDIAAKTNRWIKIASAFPAAPGCKNIRGIAGTDWLKINRPMYLRCLDSRGRRPRKAADVR